MSYVKRALAAVLPGVVRGIPNGIRIVVLTQVAYDALTPPRPNTLYVIEEAGKLYFGATPIGGTAAVPDWVGSFGTPGDIISSGLYPFQSFVAGTVATVTDPKGTGETVARFSIANTDHPYSGSPPRGDIYSSYVLRPGMDKYISIRMYTPPAGLPAAISTNNGQFLLISQLAIPGGNSRPNLTFSITSDPVIGGASDGHLHWSMFLRSPQDAQIWRGPTIDDAWHTLTVHVVTESSNAATDGSVELWYDGRKQTLYNGAQILTGIRILQIDNDRTTHKAQLGIDCYRQPNLIAGTYTLYHGTPKIGPTYTSVQ